MRAHALAIVTLLACAPPRAEIPNSPRPVENIHVESQHADYDLTSRGEGSEIRAEVEFPAAAVWGALPVVYTDLAIAVETQDPQRRFLAGAVSARRTFAKKPLSSLIDCGSSVVGPNANSYNVELRVQTEVDSTEAAAAMIRTAFTSTAASDGGMTVRCSSKGELERIIVDRIRALLIQEKK